MLRKKNLPRRRRNLVKKHYGKVSSLLSRVLSKLPIDNLFNFFNFIPGLTESFEVIWWPDKMLCKQKFSFCANMCPSKSCQIPSRPVIPYPSSRLFTWYVCFRGPNYHYKYYLIKSKHYFCERDSLCSTHYHDAGIYYTNSVRSHIGYIKTFQKIQ